MIDHLYTFLMGQNDQKQLCRLKDIHYQGILLSQEKKTFVNEMTDM